MMHQRYRQQARLRTLKRYAALGMLTLAILSVCGVFSAFIVSLSRSPVMGADVSSPRRLTEDVQAAVSPDESWDAPDSLNLQPSPPEPLSVDEFLSAYVGKCKKLSQRYNSVFKNIPSDKQKRVRNYVKEIVSNIESDDAYVSNISKTIRIRIEGIDLDDLPSNEDLLDENEFEVVNLKFLDTDILHKPCDGLDCPYKQRYIANNQIPLVAFNLGNALRNCDRCNNTGRVRN